MIKILMGMMLTWLASTLAFATQPKKSFFNDIAAKYQEIESQLFFPYPLTLKDKKITSNEVRRLVHLLKSIFVGLSGNYSASANSNYGPVMGVQFPTRFGFRLWGGLNRGRTMDLKRDYDMDAKFNGINGHRIGIGVHLTGDLSMDLEYQVIKESESADNKSYIMSLSVPISL